MKKYIKSPAVVAFETERLKASLVTRTIILATLVAVLAAIIVHHINN